MAARSSEAFELQLKVLLIGDMGVGKTCLLRRYVDDEFSPIFITTIGIDYKFKMLDVEGKRVKLQIWDTAGQERFRNITISYFRNASGIIMVYDVGERKSFDNITTWARNVADKSGESNVQQVLVANKCDLPDPEVSEEEGRALAEKLGMKFFLVSAKANLNIPGAFEHIASACVRKLAPVSTKTRTEADGTIKLDPEERNNTGTGSSKGCCK